MAYFNKLSFASGYYHISWNGIVELKEDMPDELRRRFWETWPSVWNQMMENAKTGRFTSVYPILPYMEEDPNRAQYEHLLK